MSSSYYPSHLLILKLEKNELVEYYATNHMHVLLTNVKSLHNAMLGVHKNGEPCYKETVLQRNYVCGKLCPKPHCCPFDKCSKVPL